MGHGHNEYENSIPKDHTIYKPETVPKLVELRERLAKHGLKDPWMRNEVYRYQFQEQSLIMRYIEVAGGFKCIGLGAAIGAIGAVIWKLTRDDHHHDEAEGKHH